MASLNSTESPTPTVRTVRDRQRSTTTTAELMQCLVVSPSDERRQMIRAAARAQSWDAIICRNASEFLRSVFRRRVALIVVDLTRGEGVEYREMRRAAEDSTRLSDALLLVSGAGASIDEEVWARSLGVWSYLPHADCIRGFEHVLGEAQEAIARRQQLQQPEPG